MSARGFHRNKSAMVAQRVDCTGIISDLISKEAVRFSKISVRESLRSIVLWRCRECRRRAPPGFAAWRREWDSNPRYGFPHTRFPSVRLKPLGHLSGCAVLKGWDGFCKGLRPGSLNFPQLVE